jgi:hypothetical protein
MGYVATAYGIGTSSTVERKGKERKEKKRGASDWAVMLVLEYRAIDVS